MLARAFEERFANDKNILIFASGVSNSSETDTASFERERSLLRLELSKGYKQTIYFSSCGVGLDSQNHTPYMQHKLAMESLVLATAGGIILRLPQVVGRTSNPNTLTNYLHAKILNGEHFHVWARAERNLVDVADVALIGEAIITSNETPPTIINIASETSIPVLRIVNLFEATLERRALYTTEDCGNAFPIDVSYAANVARTLGIDLGEGYTERVIRKYYGKSE